MATKGPPNLPEIVALARRQVALQGMITDNENATKDLKEQLRAVQENDLPLAMLEAGGLKKITLDSGETIEIKDDFVCGISEENREEAFNWFESHGYGALIGTTLVVEFGKGELERAQALLLALTKQKYNARVGRAVHWQTLKAFIVEQTRAAKKIPLELFGAHPFNKAIVKLPKVR